jgi:HEAT repeat protein
VTLERIIAEAKALPHFLMPIEIFSRARAIADLPSSPSLTEAVLSLAEFEPNPHARRVALIAIRFRGDFSDSRIVALLVRALKDPAPWVRYDAAWALGDSGHATENVLAGLRELARGAKKDPELSDGDARAKTQAAESLAKLTEPSA